MDTGMKKCFRQVYSVVVSLEGTFRKYLSYGEKQRTWNEMKRKLVNNGGLDTVLIDNFKITLDGEGSSYTRRTVVCVTRRGSEVIGVTVPKKL